MLSTDNIVFNPSDGLVPAVIQDVHTKQVLMLGYMNRESLQQTLDTRKVTFFSRSKQRLWMKGEQSGNVLHVVRIQKDCDNDALLVEAQPVGPTCHTGETSCFHEYPFGDRPAGDNSFLDKKPSGADSAGDNSSLDEISSGVDSADDNSFLDEKPSGVDSAGDISFLNELQELLYERMKTLPEGSYTSRMFRAGRDKLAQKVGEEAVETVIAAKNSREELTYEAADLLFHLMMLLTGEGMRLSDLADELRKRHKPDKSPQ